jgi:hypothetical protein
MIKTKYKIIKNQFNRNLHLTAKKRKENTQRSQEKIQLLMKFG